MFTTPRYPDWTSRWAHFIKDSLDLATDLRLDWGHINCTQFSGQGIEAITGQNPYEEGQWEGAFGSALDAAITIRRRGFQSLDDVIASLFVEIPLAHAWAGDVVLIKAAPSEEEEAHLIMPHGVGLADPPYYYGVTVDGLGRGDLYGEAVRCFGIGHEVVK